MKQSIALDRDSVRTTDQDGRMHISVANISKAMVNPYYGREIPHYETLRLDANKIYNLYRDPDEMEKGAHTFNNLPLFDLHVPASAENHPQDRTVGSTGTNAKFEYPYLQNGLVIWTSAAIAGVESNLQREISCGYHYDPDMTPGVVNGVAYDGVIRNIVGNHVTLCPKGRNGSDVIVGDSALELQVREDQFAVPGKRKLPIDDAKNVKLAWDLLNDTEGLTAEEKAQARTRIKHAAVDFDVDMSGWTKPQLANDQTIKEKTMTTTKEAALNAVVAKLKPYLALDADMDKVKDIISEDEEVDETEEERKEREAKEAAAKTSDAAAEVKEKAEEAEEKNKVAMDAAIAKVRKEVREEAKAFRDAERAVRHIVGDVMGMDSADEVYKFALTKSGIDVTGVHASAYPALVKTIASTPSPRPRLALDSAGTKGFSEMFPNAARVRSI